MNDLLNNISTTTYNTVTSTASTTASLVEPNVKYFLNSTLKKCNNFKEQNINFFFNVSLAGLFFIIVFTILFFKYRGNMTYREEQQRRRKDKEYIIKKLIQIKQQNNNDRMIRNNMITDLPLFGDTQPDVAVLQENKKYNPFINDF